MLDTYLPVLFQMYKQFYDSGIYGINNLQYFVKIGTLSEEDYHKIVGDNDVDAVEAKPEA